MVNDKSIKISFWNYVKSGVFKKEQVKIWKELGFNLPMSFLYEDGVSDKRDMLDILDECEKLGLKLIVCDDRTLYKTRLKKGKEEFLLGVKAAAKDFGNHPATYGFFVGDEPDCSEKEQSAFIEAINALKAECPDLTPYGNLLPYFAGSDFQMLTGRNCEFFNGLLENMIKQTNSKVVSFDVYTQCLQQDYNVQAGIDSYYYILDRFVEECKKHGADLWISLLCVGHWMYRVPDEDDIRWQIYTALAHGARGFVWFYLYHRVAGTSYRNSPLLGDGLKTETFEILKRQHYIFDKFYADTFAKIEMEKVFHTGHIYDPAKRFCEDDTVKALCGRNPYPTILTYYREFESGDRWISVVNAHQRFSNQITLTFAKSLKEVTFWLASGEMRLFKLKDVDQIEWRESE